LRKQLRLPEGFGLVVDFVEPGSPAAAAGLEPYDVLTRLDDQRLVNPQQLAVLVRTFDADAQVTLTVVREGGERQVPVKLVERDVKPIEHVMFGGPPGIHPLPRPSAPAAPAFVRPFPGGLPGAPPPALPQGAARFSAGDEVKVTILDLEGPGLQTVLHTRVTPEGAIRIPHLREPVPAAEKTGEELRMAIVDAFRGQGVASDANVQVELVRKQPPRQN
jgi:membrane-associated protease RseP (regulator of RpoE activity)